MKDFFGIPIEVGDTVIYNQKEGTYLRRGVVSYINDNKAKIKGLVKKRQGNELISDEAYIAWLDKNPEYGI